MHYTELHAMAKGQDAARADRSAPLPPSRPRLLSLLRRRAVRPAPAPGSHLPAPRLGGADACAERPPA